MWGCGLHLELLIHHQHCVRGENQKILVRLSFSSCALWSTHGTRKKKKKKKGESGDERGSLVKGVKDASHPVA